MRKHKKSLLLLALLLLLAFSMLYIGITYAKYTAEISGSATATVAKWSFEEDNKTKEITVEMDETYDATTLVEGKIAPGTEGSFAIALDNANSEVGVDFIVTIGEITDAPKNLKFYKDEAHTTELDKITGQLVAGDTTGLDVKIYWAWEYETTGGDEDDTDAGKTAKELTVPVLVTGIQTAPTSTAITSHID